MSSGPKKIETRGGARPNSGPKPQTLSVRQVQAMLDRAEARAEKEGGKTLDDILLDISYSAEEKTPDRLAAIKIYKTNSMVKPSEGGEADQQLGPGIFLPEQRPDPAKVYAINGGKT
jgi:hypothetical protein